MYVNVGRDAIKNALEYSDETLLSRAFEVDLFKHYGRPGYWEDEPVGVLPVAEMRSA